VDSVPGPKRALVLLGDPSLRGVLSARLAALGYESEAPSSPVLLLSRLGETLPDLLLLDPTASGGGGLALLYVLRRSRATRALPVLLVGDPGPAVLDEAHLLEAAGPFNPAVPESLEMWVSVATSRFAAAPHVSG
jgi:CheY-like chemotaxis protein